MFVPGQPEEIARLDRAEGFEIDAVTLQQLRTCAARAGISENEIAEMLGDQ
jgi:LDH2 family malate/lactate/ureidoglycolate dehydrogenase